MFIEIPASKKSLSNRGHVYGVGVNDSLYKIETAVNGKRYRCPYYARWADMIRRCYDETHIKRKPTYAGCVVCDEWLVFSNFRSWMELQDWKGKELDKDIIIYGNKVYSPETCVFVDQMVNVLLLDNKDRRGEWPLGVSYDKSKRKFLAQCKEKGKNINLGRFNTPEEAELKYREFKSGYIKDVAEMYSGDKRLYESLIYRSKMMKIG